MGKAQRDKGLRGQQEVTHEFARAGLIIRNLAGTGDNLVLHAGFTFHIETKRRETIKIQEWSRQAESEAPAGAIPIVIYRRSHDQWRASLPLTDLLAILLRLSPLPPAPHRE